MRSFMIILLTLYCAGDQIGVRWAGHVARMGESRVVYRGLVGTPEGKNTLGRPRHKWENNIKMDLWEVECEGMDWIDVAQDRDEWQALVNVKLIYSVKTRHILVINTVNLATCFSLLNHLQANS
jgi:hypothetical protein